MIRLQVRRSLFNRTWMFRGWSIQFWAEIWSNTNWRSEASNKVRKSDSNSGSSTTWTTRHSSKPFRIRVFPRWCRHDLREKSFKVFFKRFWRRSSSSDNVLVRSFGREWKWRKKSDPTTTLMTNTLTRSLSLSLSLMLWLSITTILSLSLYARISIPNSLKLSSTFWLFLQIVREESNPWPSINDRCLFCITFHVSLFLFPSFFTIILPY